MAKFQNLEAIQPWPEGAALFIVSNRLPVTIKRKLGNGFDVTMSSGGLVAGLREIHKQHTITWVGHGGFDCRPEHEGELSAELAQRRLVSVKLDPHIYNRFYNGMSNETIWPLFHYFPNNIRFSYGDWKAYEEVNHRFAEHILAMAQDGDRVWVHDYQLMLLPRLLRRGNPKLHIAYFHHIPFPSSDIFRVLPARKEILQGLLGANLIGFHAFDYARHFLSSVSRVLGHDIHIDDIYLPDRIAKVGVYPLGVDFQNIVCQLGKLASSQLHTKIAGNIGTPYLFLGVDRLDYTKGILERIAAFRQFLLKYPSFLGKVTLVQLCVPTRSDIKAYHDLRSEVERLVSEINGEMGTATYTPIHYLYKNLPFEQVVALYKVSHVALVTPLRDGLNLVAKEYVASQDEHNGVLILSEFAGASVEMGEALWVNPYDIRDMARKMHQAVTMPREERQRRMASLRQRVQENDNIAWSNSFMEGWQKSVALDQAQAIHLAGASRQRLVEELVPHERLFVFCDNDGTLTPICATPDLAIPDDEARALVKELGQLNNVSFTLVTGRPRSYCDDYFAGLPIHVFAEHGAYLRERASKEWRSLLNLDDFAHLKREILPVLKMFVKTVPGSHIEEKDSCLVWHYRQAEAHFAENQAKALIASLQQLLQNTAYVPYGGKKMVEVRNRMATKGHAVEHMLARHEWQPHDGLLTIGDDSSDEDMYQVHAASNASVHVGRPNYMAKHFLDNPADVKVFLRELRQARMVLSP